MSFPLKALFLSIYLNTPPFTQHLVKAITALLVGLLSGFTLYLANSHFLSNILHGGLDNDHLIVADQWLLVFAGYLNFADLVFSRLPSLFPDYVLGFLVLPSISDTPTYLAIYSIVQLLFIILALAAFVKVLLRKNILYIILFVGFVLLTLSLIKGFSFALIISSLPVNHGGNVFNVLMASCLFFLFYLRGDSLSHSNYKLLTGCFILLLFLATLSNRFFFIQFLLPAILLLCFADKPSKTRSQGFVFILLVPLSAIIISSFALVRQCADPTPQLGSSLLLSLGGKLNMLLTCGILYVLLLPAICFVFEYVLNYRLMPRGLSLFTTSSSLIGVATYLLLAPNSQLLYIRYLLGPIFLCIAFLSVLLIRAADNTNSYLFLSFWLVLLSLSAFSFRSGFYSNNARHTRTSDRHAWAIKLIKKHKLDRLNGLAVSPGWESRYLTLFLQKPNSVLNVSTDGKPLLWPHARKQYLKANSDLYTPAPSDIRDFHYFLSDPTTKGLVPPSTYGKHVTKIACLSQEYCLWRLSSSQDIMKSTFSKYFSTQASDKWRCLNESSLIHQVRKIFKQTFDFRYSTPNLGRLHKLLYPDS